MRILKSIFLGLVVTGIVGTLSMAFLLFIMTKDLPELKTLEDYNPALVTEIYANDGRKIGEFFKERRYIKPSTELSQLVKDAFISAEDDRFFEHIGIDFQGVLRAAIANIKAGRVVQGGSTITQQVAKSILLSSERSFERKFKEAILASRMEQYLKKEDILFLYLSQIYLGHGAYGVAAAAQNYFRKEVRELTVAECALLAGLAQAPSKYSPLNNSPAAKKRQIYVLNRMLQTGKINREQFEKAKIEEIKLFQRKDMNLDIAPYYVETVRQELIAKYGQEQLYRGGLKVTVAADYNLSIKARKSVRDGLYDLSKRQGYKGPIEQIKVRDKEKMLELLREVRLNLFKKKFEFVYLPRTADEHYRGEDWKQHTYERSKKLGLFKDDRELLQIGEVYKGIVTKIEKNKKSARVLVGPIQTRISVEPMRWAKRVRDGEFAYRQKIKNITEAIRVGDVINVKVLRIPVVKELAAGKQKTKKQQEAELVRVTLDQKWTAQSALISMEVDTGKVVAMVGGRDFEESEYNRVLQGARQPGSAFKPFLYAAALDKGYTPGSIIIDSPIIFENQGKQDLKWIPENHGGRYYGDTTLRMAFIKSRNVPTVKLLQDIQIPYLIDYSKNIGITEGLNRDLSLALGSNAISLIDLTKTYAIFPRNGLRIEPIYILSVKNREGQILFEHKQGDMEAAVAAKWLALREAQREKERLEAAKGITNQEKKLAKPGAAAIAKKGVRGVRKKHIKAQTFENPMRAMDEKTAYIMTDLLQQVVHDPGGTGRRAATIKKRVGGKTGTTNDFVDAWFVGFSPELVTGVWTGYDTPKTLGPGETGSKASLPSWTEFMQEATKAYSRDEYSVPKGIVFVRINPKDGSLASAGDSRAVKVAFVEGTEPSVKMKSSQVPDSSDFFKEDF